MGRVGWPQNIFNPPYPDLKGASSVIIFILIFLFLHFLSHCGCTLFNCLSHCGCTFFNFLSHCGCTLFNFLSHCGCTLFNFLSHCGCTTLFTFSKPLRLYIFLVIEVGVFFVVILLYVLLIVICYMYCCLLCLYCDLLVC